MKLLLILLFIPLSYAGSPPACGELGKILEDYEKDIQKKYLKDCKNLDPKSLVQGVELIDPKFLETRACSDLMTIETELERIKNDEAVYSGIKKLKEVIAKKKEESLTSTPAVAQEAGLSFVTNLNTAQSLETLLNTSIGDKPLVQLLKEIPSEKLQTQKDLSDRLVEFCKSQENNKADACNPTVFRPGSEAALEMIELLKAAPKADEEQVQKWKDTLAIKRKNPKDGDQTYSFTQMQQELSATFDKLDKGERMSREHLLAIKKLDEFENVSGSYIEKLIAKKDSKQLEIASGQLFFLLGDARKRQEFVSQSKMSIAWENYRSMIPDLSDAQKVDCDQSGAYFDKAVACHAHIHAVREKITPNARANMERFLEAVNYSNIYAQRLNTMSLQCENEYNEKKSLSEVCLNQIQRDQAVLQDRILQLNLLKEKIAAENAHAIKYRNFALEKWNSQGCKAQTSLMEFCEPQSSVAPQAFLALQETMKIAVLYSPQKEAEKEALALCENEELKKKSSEDRLCEFFNDTSSNIIETKNESSHPTAPTDAPDGMHDENKIKDAWIEGSTNLLKEILPYFIPKVSAPPGVNPYPANHVPYNGGAGPMGIADTIMFNARHHGGYGLYVPTAGYQPYQAFGPKMPTAGRYFGR